MDSTRGWGVADVHSERNYCGRGLLEDDTTVLMCVAYKTRCERNV